MATRNLPTSTLFSWARRNLRRQGRRTLLSGIAVLLAFWALLMLSAFIGGMNEGLEKVLRNFTSGDVLLVDSNYWQFKRFQPLRYSISSYQDLANELEAMPEVSQVVPVVEVGAQGFKSVGGVVSNPITQPLSLRASDLQREDASSQLSSYLQEGGQLPQPGKRELLLSVSLAHQMELGVGDKLTLILYNSHLNQTLVTFTISGLYKLPGNALSSSALAPLGVVQRLLALPDQVLSLHVLAADGVSRQDLSKQLASWADQHSFSRISWEDVDAIYQSMKTDKGMFMLFRLIFIILAATILLNTMTMAFFDRSMELATLETLGMKRSNIRSLLMAESGILSIAAMVLAGLISAGLSAWAQAAGGVSLWGEDLSTSLGMPDKIFLPLHAANYLTNGIALLIVIQLAVLTPVRQLQKQPLVAGLRGLTPGQGPRRRKKKKSGQEPHSPHNRRNA